MAVRTRKYLPCALLLWAAAEARGDMITGGCAAVKDSAIATNINPANAAFIPRTQVEVGLIPLKKTELRVHYPNVEPIDKKNFSYGVPEEIPAYIYKVSNRLGVSLIAAPPMPMNIPVTFRGVPVVVFDSYDSVDITAQGKIYGYANFILGYRVSPELGFGLRMDYLSFGGEASIKPADGSTTLGGIKIKLTSMGILFGIRGSMLGDTLGFGLASRVYDSSTMDVSTDGAIAATGAGEKPPVQPLLLNSVLAGAKMRMSRSVTAYVDGEYTRQPSAANGFSMVTLKSQKKDVYPTLALRGGVESRISRRSYLIGGGAYEPAQIGPGGKGDGARSGFGSLEMMEIYMLDGTIRPYWQLGGGFRFNAGLIHHKRRMRDDDPDKWRGDEAYAYTISMGLIYRRSSLGVDENGEQPGSYLQTQWIVPLTITARM